MNDQQNSTSPSDETATPSWSLIAPVFNHQRQRNGCWLEFSCSEEEAATLKDILTEHLDEHYQPWLFIVANPMVDTLELPLDIGKTDQILIMPSETLAKGARLTPEGVRPGWYGPLVSLRSQGVDKKGWYVTPEPAGKTGIGYWMADGLASWDDTGFLISEGWKGFLFTRNSNAKTDETATDRIALTKLLSLVTRDAETDDIEALLKQQPRLAFDLLKLVNSSALKLRSPVTNFRRAITVLGRRQLQRWLQLLLFTRSSGDSQANVLLWHSAYRGRLMEQLGARLEWDQDTVDEAFMIGVFSLLDMLMGTSLEELLTPLGLPDAISQALLNETGTQGDLLALARAVERRDGATVGHKAQQLGISVDTLLATQLECIDWVDSLSMPNG
jgi:EAL and modified HD-GYP domain-containing signal transduction protein